MSDVIETQWSHTFSAFAGCDIIVSIGNEVIGELQKISWEEDLVTEDEYKVTGKIFIVNFDRDPIEDLVDRKEPFNISISFANELGKKAHIGIYQAELLTRACTNSIDDIGFIEVFTYKAKSLEKTYGEKKTGEG